MNKDIIQQLEIKLTKFEIAKILNNYTVICRNSIASIEVHISLTEEEKENGML